MNYDFGQLADQWWNPNGAMKTLHDINVVRTEFIHNLTQHKNDLIDIGCGAGIFTESIAKLGYQVTGIDCSKKLIDLAISHAKIDKLDINYQNLNVQELINYKQKFSVITCLELIEHTNNPEQIISILSNICQPGGYVFISTLNKNLKSWLLAILAAEYLLNIVPKGTHSYENFIKPSTIFEIAKKYDLKLIKTNGINYNPFSREATLINNLDVNYILCFQKN